MIVSSYEFLNMSNTYSILILLVFYQKSDIFLDFKGFGCGSKSLIGLTESVEQDLLKIPPNIFLRERGVVQHLGVVQVRYGGLTATQGPGVDREPVLTVDICPGEECKIRLEVVAWPHVPNGVHDLIWVP